jgi:hypothetical protein
VFRINVFLIELCNRDAVCFLVNRSLNLISLCFQEKNIFQHNSTYNNLSAEILNLNLVYACSVQGKIKESCFTEANSKP